MPFHPRHRLPVELAEDESPERLVVGVRASGHRGGLLVTIGSDRVRNQFAIDIRGSGLNDESFHGPSKKIDQPGCFFA
jgi:hypothetical protein